MNHFSNISITIHPFLSKIGFFPHQIFLIKNFVMRFSVTEKKELLIKLPKICRTYPNPNPRMVKKASRGGTKPRRATYCTLRVSLMQNGMGILNPRRFTMMAIGYKKKAVMVKVEKHYTANNALIHVFLS